MYTFEKQYAGNDTQRLLKWIYTLFNGEFMCVSKKEERKGKQENKAGRKKLKGIKEVKNKVKEKTKASKEGSKKWKEEKA
jgi:hypothetical protein